MSSTTCRMWGAYHLTRSVCSNVLAKGLPSSFAISDRLSCFPRYELISILHHTSALNSLELGKVLQQAQAGDTVHRVLQLPAFEVSVESAWQPSACWCQWECRFACS